MYNFTAARSSFLKSVGALAVSALIGGLCGEHALAQSVSTTTTLNPALVKIIASGVTAPEGPSVLPDGSVAMMEFSLGNIVRVSMNGSKEVLAHPGSGVAGTVLGKDGALYVAKLDTGAFMRRMGTNATAGMDAAPPADAAGMGAPADGGMSSGMSAMDGTPSAMLRIDLKTKQVTKLYTEVNGKPLGSPNDLVVDSWGDLWITEQTAPGVINARTDGSQIKLLIEGTKGVNGITLSPDKRTLYVMSDRKLTAYQITGRGALKSEQGKPVGTLVTVWPEKLHEPDGMKTEANGNILCAAWEDGIVRFSPTGKLLSQTIVPDQQVINLVFSPTEKNVLYLAAHPANNMSGSLVKIPWDAVGMP